MLVATADQFDTLDEIGHIMSIATVKRIGTNIQFQNLETIDFEDSRALLKTLNDRLSPKNPKLFKPLPFTALVVLLQFVVTLAQPLTGLERLYPTLFGRTLERVWKTIEVEKGDESPGTMIDATGCVFLYLR